LDLKAMVSIMSTPRHSERMGGNYISSSSEYASLFIENLRNVTGNSPFWSTLNP